MKIILFICILHKIYLPKNLAMYQYINPFELLGFASPQEITPETIRKAKRKLLIEFDLRTDQMLDYRGKSFSKDQIFKVIEELENQSTIEFHFIIFQDKAFLTFLTEGNIKSIKHIQYQTKYYHADFIKFLAPIYIQVFSNLLVEYYLKNDAYAIHLLLNYNLFKNRPERRKCFQKLEFRLQFVLERLRELRKNITDHSADSNNWLELKNIFDNDLHFYAFNALESQYYSLCKDIVFEIYSIFRYEVTPKEYKDLINKHIKQLNSLQEPYFSLSQPTKKRAWAYYEEKNNVPSYVYFLFFTFIYIAVFVSKCGQNDNSFRPQQIETLNEVFKQQRINAILFDTTSIEHKQMFERLRILKQNKDYDYKHIKKVAAAVTLKRRNATLEDSLQYEYSRFLNLGKSVTQNVPLNVNLLIYRNTENAQKRKIIALLHKINQIFYTFDKKKSKQINKDSLFRKTKDTIRQIDTVSTTTF